MERIAAAGQRPQDEDVPAPGSHDPGEVQRPSLDARLHRRRVASLLRRDRRRRNVYNKRTASGDLHHQVWHEKYGKQEQQVTVGAKESKTVDFTMKG